MRGRAIRMTETQASPLPKQRADIAHDKEDAGQAPRCAERLQFVSLLFELHRGPLMRHLTGLLTRRADAEDVLQETCTRLLKVRHLDRTPARARAYMFRIATNLAYDRFRSRSTEPLQIPGTEIKLGARQNLARAATDLRRRCTKTLSSASTPFRAFT